MTQFIIRRLILFIPALLGILLITFVLARLIPGDPCVAMLG
jgi:peptide/nickel transport system permease protein